MGSEDVEGRLWVSLSTGHVLLSQGGPHDVPGLLPSILFEGPRAGKHILGVKPFPPWGLYYIHTHARTQISASPFAVPMALRPHGPDLGWVAH